VQAVFLTPLSSECALHLAFLWWAVDTLCYVEEILGMVHALLFFGGQLTRWYVGETMWHGTHLVCSASECQLQL